MKPTFSPGNNIAIKVPFHEFDSMVAFYRDILGFKDVEASSSDDMDSVVLKFGDKNIWIDRTAGLSQAEIWLEVVTDDIEKAADYFKENNIIRRDEIEPLPDGLKGFWIASPANIIHLISE